MFIDLRSFISKFLIFLFVFLLQNNCGFAHKKTKINKQTSLFQNSIENYHNFKDELLKAKNKNIKLIKTDKNSDLYKNKSESNKKHVLTDEYYKEDEMSNFEKSKFTDFFKGKREDPRGIPCLDGNCVDKSYLIEEDMMESISKLSILNNTNSKFDNSFDEFFSGICRSCSKKFGGIKNCCGNFRGWGLKIGMKCNESEKKLLNAQRNNLCVFIGRKKKRRLGIKVSTRYYFCCFKNQLDKEIQVQGREQLGLNFGSSKSPNCRGLTIKQMQEIDFDKIDFTNIASELSKNFSKTHKINKKELIKSIKKNLNFTIGVNGNNDSSGTKAGFNKLFINNK
jgi:conjugal transfer mating pair stabilization protein TraN